VVTPEGKRYAVFRSTFRSVEVSSDLRETSLSVELNEDVAHKFRQKLFRLSCRDGARGSKA
jgi:hypothetical protein